MEISEQRAASLHCKRVINELIGKHIPTAHAAACISNRRSKPNKPKLLSILGVRQCLLMVGDKVLDCGVVWIV